MKTKAVQPRDIENERSLTLNSEESTRSGLHGDLATNVAG
jgi:hypothetical protein